MTRFAGMGPDEDDATDVSEVSRLDWRIFCRVEEPDWTDAQCDADWRKHFYRARRSR